MRLTELVERSDAVADTGSRNAKIERLAECLARFAPEEIEIGAAYLAGELPQGRIGVGPSVLRDAALGPPAASGSLDLSELDRALEAIRTPRGRGAASQRRAHLQALFARVTVRERRFLTDLLLGNLRQGALEGVLLEAVARAAGVAAAEVRRAAMVGGSLRAVARAALLDGAPGLGSFRLELFRPLQPMLATPAESVDAALERLGHAAVEFKLDGARVQVHRQSDRVRVFTRSGNEVTEALPEIVDLVRALPVRSAVLDGEALALREDGRPHPFQVTMRRFGRRADVEALRGKLPLSSFFFDCLHLDGEDLLGHRYADRYSALSRAAETALRIPRAVTGEAGQIQAFLERALEAGHEGVVLKSLDARYEAGRRGAEWFKVKPVHHLDLVVLAAEWGSGRRRGWLSNLHLGARDPDSGGFVMLGKTFKGMTDEILAWQTERLLSLEVRREGHTVYVAPALVAEVAFDGLQDSPHYPGGLALRFARLRTYRLDKRPEEADSIETVRAMRR